MFRTIYTTLTEKQIAEKLAQVSSAPECACAVSDRLAGKKLSVVTDKGLALDYCFSGPHDLVFSADGGAELKAQYTALELKNLVLFSHLVPGTQTSYHVIWDTKTDLVTAFEVWFSGTGIKQAREAQREIYFGYAKREGKEAPQARHSFTNRFENKGIVWTDNRGVSILTVYNSICYSTFVELSAPRGGITIATPADYIKINDEFYIYSRVEAEFSGTLVLEAIDLFSITQIGVRLGFDENDAFDYTMYTGKGELAGQLATFSKFTDYGGNYDFEKMASFVLPGESTVKGRRPVYRVHGEYADITEEEARNSGRNPNTFPKVSESVMPVGNSMEDSDYLIGKKFTVRCDNGPAWEYEVSDISSMRWKAVGESEWHEETYKAFEPAGGLIMLAHMQTGTDFGRGIVAALDFENGLATVFHNKMGNGYAFREVGYELYFGTVEVPGGPQAPKWLRHTRTTDLVGRAFTWNYSGGDDGITSMHVYTSPWAYSWTIYLENGEGGLIWSSPCDYIKLRDECYIMSWVEETSAGGQGTVLMNLRTMHDCGFFYGLGAGNQVSMSTMGAFARSAGQLDILKYFTPKSE